MKPERPMKYERKHALTVCSILMSIVLTGCSTLFPGGGPEESQGEEGFSFFVAADMRGFAEPKYQSSEYFLGACEAMRDLGSGIFMVSPGDIDPPQHVLDTLRKTLGEEFPWYPVVGNHEAETPEDMTWIREWCQTISPDLLRRGPANGEETTYSFDHGNAHFVVLNLYFDGQSDVGTNGDVGDALYAWLENDLALNAHPIVFVFGHEPIVSIPDLDSGRHRHRGDNLDAHPANSHRFQQLLRAHEVTAYVCGHTHGFSFTEINGLWQIDAGHARGIGDPDAPSTFLEFHVGPDDCRIEVYRDDSKGGEYTLTRTIPLD
jgi:hypothetical protein